MLRIADRVKETTTTTGTGALALAGAATAHIAFSAIPNITVSDTCYCCVQAVDGSGVPTGDWEVALYTYSAANELTHTTFLASSTGSAVSWAAGTKQVMLVNPAIGTKSPAFSAYASSDQAITTNTYTKVSLQTEEFDTNSAFDNATNFRFQPTVPGYYQINGSINCGASSGLTVGYATIYKNGSLYKTGNIVAPFSATLTYSNISCLVFLNGSTDYIELWGLIVATSPKFVATSTTGLSGSLVRTGP